MIIYKFMFSKGIAYMTNKVTKRTFIDIFSGEELYIFFQEEGTKAPDDENKPGKTFKRSHFHNYFLTFI